MTGPQIAETTPRSRRRWTARMLAVAAVLGPGLIAANAGNDAGKILTNASANAQFTYRTLFLMLLVTHVAAKLPEVHATRWD
jgi:Mn2+/Fe2+ NRAMP family transporter